MSFRPLTLSHLSSLVLVLAACGGSDDGTTPDPTPFGDAGTPDGQADATTEASADASGPDGGKHDGGGDASPDATDGSAPDAADGESDAEPDVEPFDAGPDPCGEVDTFGPVFPDVIATWSAQDSLGGWPPGPVVFTGSSSIRRWEGLAAAYTDYAPLQRGFGGAQLGEVAFYTEELVTRHDPRAVVVFAGTNDIDAGVAPDVVVERFRCFRYRVGQALGWDRPIVFIGITPTPARWSEWTEADAVNDAIQTIANGDPGVYYADVPSAFLATGSPPETSLFAADQLHLSPSGYDLWDSVLRPVVEAATTASQEAGANPDFTSGARLLIDLGPSNPQDGEPTPSPDYLGHHWNNWHAVQGGTGILPGEQLVGLVADDGSSTGVDLVIAGGFYPYGRSNGGLLWPDGTALGDFAVGSATGDFFFSTDDDAPGALFFRGLDPDASYELRLFAARDEAETRITRYTVTGASTVTATLQTSGSGAGSAGATTNDDDIVTFTGLEPDAWGHLFVDVAIEAGSYAYLSALGLQAE